MPATLSKPTSDSVRKLREKLLMDWGPCFKANEVIRDLVHRRNGIEVLEADPDRNIKPFEIHSGRAGGVIDHAGGLLMTMPEWSMEPRGLDSVRKEQAERIEIVTAKLFEQQILHTDFWAAVTKEVLMYGRTFLKSLPLPSVWTAQAGFPIRGKRQSASNYLEKVKNWKATEAKFPFVIAHISTLNILPLVDHNDTVVASLEEKEVLAGVLADKDGMNSPVVRELLARGTVEWYDELPVLEYIDTDWVGYFLLGTTPRKIRDRQGTILQGVREPFEELRVWRHGLGKCPVTMILGLKTEMRDYEDRYKSFLADAQEPLELYDFLLSRLATMVGAYYLPSYIMKLQESGVMTGGKDRPPLHVKLGGVTPIYSDEELLELPIPRGLPDANVLIEVTDDLIQRHTLEDVLYGRVQGSAPAFQVNLRINVARSKLTPIAQHMAQGITNAMDLFYRGVEWLGEPVVIDGEEFTVAMAKAARGRVTASIEPKGPADRAQDIGTAKMFLEFGMPWDWIVENVLDVSSPALLRLEKAVQDLEKLPPIQERLVREVLGELDILEEQEGFTGAEALQGEEMPAGLQQALQMLQQGGEGGGLGVGPYPIGGAPQTIQGGRGLLTPNTQPQPMTPQAGTEGMM